MMEGQSLEDFSLETNILFGLKGSFRIELDTRDFILNPGDVLVLNRNENYRIESQERSVLMNLIIENEYFLSIYDDFLSVKFECYPDNESLKRLDGLNQLKAELSQFLIFYLNHSNTKSLNLSISLNKILLTLISYFKSDEGVYASIDMDDKTIAILKEVEKYYWKDLSLEGLSEKYYMSPSTLSKTFKRNTGKYFSSYLNELRIKKSLKDLLYSTKTIEEISLKYGFNNHKTYRSWFKRIYGRSPRDYRNRVKDWPRDTFLETREFSLDDSSADDILETLYLNMTNAKKSIKSGLPVENYTKISLNSNINRSQIHPDKIIHVGALSLLLEEEILEELNMVVEDIGLDYIGISKLYEIFPSSYSVLTIDDTKDIHVYGDLGKFDRIVHRLLREDIGIIYELVLAENSLNTSEFNLLYSFLEHGKKSYTEKFFEKFKVNFIFDSRNIVEEYELLKVFRARLLELSPLVKIGGSIPLSHPDYKFESSDHEKLYFTSIVKDLDFLSYRSDPNQVYEHNKNLVLDMEVFNEYVYKEVLSLKEILRRHSVSLPLVLMEWNTLTGKKQTINGTFFRGAIILQEILKLDLHIDSYGFWLNAGVYKKFKLNKFTKYSSLELFHNYSEKKPVYNVLKLASRLKGNILFLGKESMLLKSQDGYQLLMWNSNYFNPKLSKETKFLESQAVSYNIEVKDIEDGYYQIKRFDLNRYFGALYYEFKEFKSDIPLDYESHQYIKNNLNPKLSVFDMRVEDGFKFNCILDTNAITLLEFRRIDK